MIKNILQWLLVGTVALAQSPSNNFKFGDGQPSNKSVTFNRSTTQPNPSIRWNESGAQLEFSNDGQNYTGIGSGSGSGSGLNLISTNPDFENGISLGWSTTGSGAFLPVSSGANLLFGKGSATFQAFTGAASASSSLYPIPVGLQGKPCSVAVYYKGADGNMLLQAVDNTNTILASTPFVAATQTTLLAVPFQCPASGQVKLRLISTGAAALVAFDRTYLGEQNNLSQISQASFFGSMVKKSSDPNCQVDYGTVNATYVDPTSNPCVFTALGNITPQAAPILGWTAQVPAGTYLFTMGFSLNFSAGGGNPSCRIIDDLGNEVRATYQQANSPGNLIAYQGTIQPIVYASSGLRTYNVQCRDAGVSNHLEIYGVQDFEPSFTMWRFPSQSQTVYSPETVDWTYQLGYVSTAGDIFTDDIASSGQWVPMMDITDGLTVAPINGSGSALISCSGTTFNTGSGCGSDHADFGAIINVPRPGQVSVDAEITHCWAGSASITYNYNIVEVTNGTQTIIQDISSPQSTGNLNAGLNTQTCVPVTLHGIMNFKTVGLHTIKVMANGSQAITHASSYWLFNASNTTTSPGSLGQAAMLTIKPLNQQVPAPILMNQITTDSGGVDKIARVLFGGTGTGLSMTGCGSDPCVIYNQSGSVSAVNRTATGSYVIHFAPGTFSDVPTCTCTAQTGGNGICSVDVGPGPTLTAVPVRTTGSNTGNVIDGNAAVICMGPH